MKALKLLLVACGLLLPAQGTAQTGTPGAPVPSDAASGERLAVARELVRLLNVQEAAGAGVQIMLDQQISQNPAMAPHRKLLEDWARDVFGGAEAETAFATMYAETFTVSELHQIRTFYQSSAGQRLAAEQKNLALRGAEVGRRLAEAHVGELMQRIQSAKTTP